MEQSNSFSHFDNQSIINSHKQAMFKTSVIIWLHRAYFQKFYLDQKTWNLDCKEYNSQTSWEELWLNRDLEL